MAKPLFGPNDFVPSRIKSIKVDASVEMGSFVKFDMKVVSKVDFERRITAAISRASVRIAVDLKSALDAAMGSAVWGSDDPNIYDSGQLMASGSVVADGKTIRVSYDEDYAAIIHYGGYIAPYGNVNAKVYLPPKPWVDAVLRGGGPVQKFNFDRYYREEILKEFA